jgi:hypothetical protein
MSKRKSWMVTMGLLGILPACVSGEPTPAPTNTTPAQTTAAVSLPLPAPLAQLKQENGNTISFYDLKGTSLITGEGIAGNPPAFPPDMPQGNVNVLDAWNKVSGGRAAPQALVDFQNRLAAKPAPLATVKVTKTSSSSTTGGLSAENVPLNTPEGTLAAPTGCNNGCCDASWLSGFPECGGGLDFHWFLFNYSYSYADATDVNFVGAMVCSAIGTTSWGFTVSETNDGAVSWTMPVAQAHFLETSWSRGTWPWDNAGALFSNVNSASNQHLHTHCGIVQYYSAF